MTTFDGIDPDRLGALGRQAGTMSAAAMEARSEAGKLVDTCQLEDFAFSHSDLLWEVWRDMDQVSQIAEAKANQMIQASRNGYITPLGDEYYELMDSLLRGLNNGIGDADPSDSAHLDPELAKILDDLGVEDGDVPPNRFTEAFIAAMKSENPDAVKVVSDALFDYLGEMSGPEREEYMKQTHFNPDTLIVATNSVGIPPIPEVIDLMNMHLSADPANDDKHFYNYDPELVNLMKDRGMDPHDLKRREADFKFQLEKFANSSDANAEIFLEGIVRTATTMESVAALTREVALDKIEFVLKSSNTSPGWSLRLSRAMQAGATDEEISEILNAGIDLAAQHQLIDSEYKSIYLEGLANFNEQLRVANPKVIIHFDAIVKFLMGEFGVPGSGLSDVLETEDLQAHADAQTNAETSAKNLALSILWLTDRDTANEIMRQAGREGYDPEMVAGLTEEEWRRVDAAELKPLEDLTDLMDK